MGLMPVSNNDKVLDSMIDFNGYSPPVKGNH